MKPIKIRIKEDNFLSNSTLIDDAIQKIGFPCILTIRKDIASISENQRNYYFGVVVQAVQDYTGYSKEETHKMLKAHFLIDYEELLQNMVQTTSNDDKTFQLARFISLCDDITITTSEKGEFEEFLRKIRSYYSEKGVFIPLPRENEKWEGWNKIL